MFVRRACGVCQEGMQCLSGGHAVFVRRACSVCPDGIVCPEGMQCLYYICLEFKEATTPA